MPTERNAKDRQLSNVRVDDALWNRLQADAVANFEKVTDTVRRRLAESFKADGGGGGPVIKTAAQELRERKEELAIEKMERDAAIERKEMIRIDEVCEVVLKDYAEIRQEALSIPQAASIELALTEEQTRGLAKIVNDKFMTELSGEKRETFDAIAAK